MVNRGPAGPSKHNLIPPNMTQDNLLPLLHTQSGHSKDNPDKPALRPHSQSPDSSLGGPCCSLSTLESVRRAVHSTQILQLCGTTIQGFHRRF